MLVLSADVSGLAQIPLAAFRRPCRDLKSTLSHPAQFAQKVLKYPTSFRSTGQYLNYVYQCFCISWKSLFPLSGFDEPPSVLTSFKCRPIPLLACEYMGFCFFCEVQCREIAHTVLSLLFSGRKKRILIQRMQQTASFTFVGENSRRSAD